MLFTVKNGRYFIIMVLFSGSKKGGRLHGRLFMYVEKW